jgi:membrane dipeptidase
MIDPESAALHRAATVVDLHSHGLGMLPRPVDALYRAATLGRRPDDLALDVARAACVDLMVVCAVGDAVVTRWHRGSPWQTVERQLAAIEQQAERAGVAVVLGLEGADVLDGDLDRVDRLHELGVRVAGLVHFADNCCGTCCMPWQRWSPVPLPLARPTQGLTPFGAQVVARMTELAMVVDLAHADRATTLAACALATAPMVSSHTGAARLGDFERFISDDEIRAIASTGGVIGLWPFRFGRRGVRDLEDWLRHAVHVAGLVGVEHLAIGTDQNGVSGLMDGYRGLHDLPVLTAALRRAFADDDVRAIIGGNALRVLRAVSARDG